MPSPAAAFLSSSKRLSCPSRANAQRQEERITLTVHPIGGEEILCLLVDAYLAPPPTKKALAAEGRRKTNRVGDGDCADTSFLQ
jgi:hypothetical protein